MLDVWHIQSLRHIAARYAEFSPSQINTEIHENTKRMVDNQGSKLAVVLHPQTTIFPTGATKTVGVVAHLGYQKPVTELC